MKKSRKIGAFLANVVMVLTISLAGHGVFGNTSEALAGKGPVVLKLGHISNTVHPYHKCAVLLAEELAARTNGQVKMEVYPSAQLGSQKELIEGLQMGSIDFVVSGTSILSNFSPKVSVVDLPFIFRDKEHAYKVLDSEVGQEIFSGIGRVGVFLAAWENGWRVFFNAKREIRTPKDLVGLKLRCQDAQIMVDIFAALGATPTPMALGELYSALQQGTVDGADNTIASLYSDKGYEVTSFLTITNHSYSPSVAIMSNFVEKKVGPENAKIIKELFVKYRDIERAMNAKQDLDAIEDMKSKGMKVYYPTNAERSMFAGKGKSVWLKYRDKVGGQELIDKIVAVQ
ncbi:MAG: DctP family TRAP transporter solute-binding subunit [Desulfovibrio sp.]|jgi:tripartite ATP-independent transporter DctP family solute receptor|nr:DctP family TRAP transporter solute-binding subunit [Desulfovibrio sp.]